MPDRPDWRDEIRRRLEPLDLTATREAEIVEEVAQHLEDRYQELRASGRDDETAAADAWRELDETDVLRREVARVERPAPLDLPPPGAPARGRWLGALWQDARYAVRALGRSPGFSLTVLLAVALSIGPTTAILSIGNLLLWRPPPGIAEPDRLAVVWFGRWDETGMSPSWLTYQNLDDAIGRAQLAAGIAGGQERSVSLAIPGAAPRTVGMSHATANLFDMLGVRLSAGRRFLPEEDRLGGTPVAIISDGLARSAFGGPEAAIEKAVFLNSRPFTVVGVAAPEFKGVSPMSLVDVWITGSTLGYVSHSDRPAPARFYSFIVRLAPGATFQSLESELNGLVQHLVDVSEENARFKAVQARVFPGLGVEPLARPRTQKMVRIMLLIGGALLVLGCANIANLLLFRTTRRQNEIAVRKALGASRVRLVQAQLVESCILALSGAAVGLGLAFLLKQLIHHLLFPRPPGVEFTVPIDGRILAVTAAAAIVSGLVASIAPAWIAAAGRGAGSIGRSGLRASARAPRLRGSLAALQLALSLTLLVGALLFVTTLRNLRAVDLGFDPQNVTALPIDLNSHGYSFERALEYHRTVLSELEAQGEFAGVTLAAEPAFSSHYERVTSPDGDQAAPVRAGSNGVTHDYFTVMSIPIVRGRPFTRQESFAAGGDPPVIVNETLAERLYGTIDVVGRRLRFPRTLAHPTRDLPIIGVARDTRARRITEAPEPFVYHPFGRDDLVSMRASFVIRSGLPSAQVSRIASSIASRIDSRVPFAFVRPLTMDLDRQVSQERVFAWLFGLMAALAFVLASLGLYGLVSQTTTERRREFGIRMAIGASGLEIVRLVSRYALMVSVSGVVAGLGLAWFGTRMVSSMLFGVSRLDPMAYVAAVATLVMVVVLSCIAPTLRALRVQPVEVLRAE
ncbi:MAG: ADOP family duplicated permease [Vicinamibacterales bacterium]